MLGILRAVAILAGLLIALVAFALDYLLPGTSPGLNLPQILAIAVGLAIAFLAWRLRIERLGKLSPARMARAVLVIVAVLCVTLLILELALAAWGLPAYFPSQLVEQDYEVISFYYCDDISCRLNYDGIAAKCAAGQWGPRMCKVNRQGYPDSHDFAADDALASQRVLAVGDSFTHGFKSSVGNSFIETLEAAMPETMVWNGGISATGTSEQLDVFRHLAPMLQPQLTILGFFTNDFANNVIQKAKPVTLRDAQGRLIFAPFEQADRWGNPLDIPVETVHAYALQGSRPPTSELERALGVTRLGTLFLRTLDSIAERFNDRSWKRQVELTRQYLAELRDEVTANGSQMLVIVIPTREDFEAPTREHDAAIDLMDELALPYIRALDFLAGDADYAPRPDFHWNNAGHQKIGKLLSECVSSFFAGAGLGECPHVTVK